MKLRFSFILAIGVWQSLTSTTTIHAQPTHITAETGAVAVGGNVTESTINIGIHPDQLAAIVRQATQLSETQDKLITKLESELDLNKRQISAALHILGENDIAPEQLALRLVEIAEQFKALQASAAAQAGDTQHVTDLKSAAQQAIDGGDLAKADGLLAEVEAAQHAAFEAEKRRALEHLTLISVNEAETSARRAQIALTRLRYIDAAKLFANAAALIPSTNAHETKQLDYLRKEASAYYKQGAEFGDNGALVSAIERYKRIIASISKDATPLEWAKAQNALGAALRSLGERENEPDKLQEAVFVFRAALREEGRDQAPLTWAETQDNLGFVLFRLGEREGTTAKLEEALAAFREALNVRTRERAPLAWAATQNNLGLVLWRLGLRESGTVKLEDAVGAYQAALQERTRERVPLAWATTENNLGNSLSELGLRVNGTAKLEEAVIAYRAALEEQTRERTPLAWALIQNNLGNSLSALGQRMNQIAKLDEAIVAYQQALQETTRERAPLSWAMTQNNLGNALREIGRRNHDLTKLEAAVEAYHSSLQERTRERVPLDWAKVTANQGIALMLIAEQRRDFAMTEVAIGQMKVAFEVARDGGDVVNAAYYERQLGWAHVTADRMHDK